MGGEYKHRVFQDSKGTGHPGQLCCSVSSVKYTWGGAAWPGYRTPPELLYKMNVQKSVAVVYLINDHLKLSESIYSFNKHF